MVGWMMRDTFITRDEIRGLMAETLYVTTPPTGKTALTGWMKKNSATLGLNYASELSRRRDRQTPYF
jgi:NADH dehydrogenase